MPALTRALLPIDLSLNYQPLSLTTRKMFDRRDTGIVILHAIEELPCSARGTEVARSLAQIEFLARRDFEFAQVSPLVERGRAADRILDYVQSHEVDVIIMAAGKRESPGRGSLGHVTEEVMMGAPCAVWAERVPGPSECVRHICCAVSLDDSDEAVLCRAAEIAADFSAELTILHAVVPESPMAVWWDVDAMEQEVRTARMRVGDLREKFAPAARLHVEAGRLEWVASRELRRLNAGLLVAAGTGTPVVAGAVACPVLRVATASSKTANRARRAGATFFTAAG